MNTNFVILVGYVGQELKSGHAYKGSKRIALRVATHSPTISPQGKRTIQTIWHDVVAWDQVGGLAERNFVKGSRIMVQGTIEYRTWPDHNNHLRYYTRIKAQSLTNLDR